MLSAFTPNVAAGATATVQLTARAGLLPDTVVITVTGSSQALPTVADTVSTTTSSPVGLP